MLVSLKLFCEKQFLHWFREICKERSIVWRKLNEIIFRQLQMLELLVTFWVTEFCSSPSTCQFFLLLMLLCLVAFRKLCKGICPLSPCWMSLTPACLLCEWWLFKLIYCPSYTQNNFWYLLIKKKDFTIHVPAIEVPLWISHALNAFFSRICFGGTLNFKLMSSAYSRIAQTLPEFHRPVAT